MLLSVVSRIPHRGPAQRALGPSSKKNEKTDAKQRSRCHKQNKDQKKQHQTAKPPPINETAATTKTRYGRNAIRSSIPQFPATTNDVITGMGVTQFQTQYPQHSSCKAGCYHIGYANQVGYTVCRGTLTVEDRLHQLGRAGRL